jgi:hypothetical protein
VDDGGALHSTDGGVHGRDLDLSRVGPKTKWRFCLMGFANNRHARVF